MGQTVRLQLQRGGEDVEVEVEVGDLHKITPDRFVSVAGGSFHDLSYQQARMYGVACKGVYVCEATGSFRFESSDNGWIIQTVDHKKVADLDAFIEVTKQVPDKARIVVDIQAPPGPAHAAHLGHLRGPALVLQDEAGGAQRRDRPLGLHRPGRPAAAGAAGAAQGLVHPAGAHVQPGGGGPGAQLRARLVHHAYEAGRLPQEPQGRHGPRHRRRQGLVIISRAVVPYDLCDISITIADSIIVEGKVVFLHPLQNYSIVQYDPRLVDAPVLSARLSTEQITQGASTSFIGYNRIGRIVHAATTVTEIFAVGIPANSGAPRYRAVNVDAITVDTNLSQNCGSGVLVAPDGTVQALWLTYLGERSPTTHRDEEYHLGLATPTLLPVIAQIQRGEAPRLRLLSVEFRPIAMSQARLMGVSEEWIQKVSLANTAHHQLFMVFKRTFERGEPEGAGLLEGDVLLTLNETLITRISELDVMYSHEVLNAVIVRECHELHVELPTVSSDDLETDHAVSFCGAILHRPHQAVRQQISKLFSEVYVSARTRGSPAYQYGLAPTNFITHVNATATPNLESFVAAVIQIPDNTCMCIPIPSPSNCPFPLLFTNAAPRAPS